MYASSLKGKAKRTARRMGTEKASLKRSSLDIGELRKCAGSLDAAEFTALEKEYVQAGRYNKATRTVKPRRDMVRPQAWVYGTTFRNFKEEASAAADIQEYYGMEGRQDTLCMEYNMWYDPYYDEFARYQDGLQYPDGESRYEEDFGMKIAM